MDIKKIKLNPDNPRIINDDKFQKLKKSIEEFPEMLEKRPIVIDEKNIILGGNMRYKAAKELGMKDIPVIVAEDWTAEQKKEFLIKDNVGFGDWELGELSQKFDHDQLEEWGLDIQFGEETVEEEKGEPEAITIIPKNVVVEKGDIFELGDHRLMCGDATNTDDMEKLMDGKNADMVFTDPPYNTGMGGEKQKDSTWLNHMFDDNFTEEDWQQFMADFCGTCFMFLKEDTVAYISLDWRRNHQLIPHINKYFHLSNVIVWDKMVHGLGSYYKYTYGLINVCKKGKPKMKTHQGDREYCDIWHIQRKMGKDEDHATKKPLELVERPIRHSSKKGDIILDIFGGSGSTLLASERKKRKCYMMELDEKYIQVIIKRYRNYSKKPIKCLNRDLDIDLILGDTGKK